MRIAAISTPQNEERNYAKVSIRTYLLILLGTIAFFIVINDDNSVINMSIFCINKETNAEVKLDSIKVKMGDIKESLIETNFLIDSVTSPLRNTYTYSIKNKSDSC